MTAKKSIKGSVGKRMGRMGGDKGKRPVTGRPGKPPKVAHEGPAYAARYLREVIENCVIPRILKGEPVKVLYGFTTDETRVIKVLINLPDGLFGGQRVYDNQPIVSMFRGT